MPSKFLPSLLMAMVFIPDKLKPLKPSTKMEVGHTSPSLAPWKHGGDRETKAVSAGPASPRCHSTHSSRSSSSRWSRIVQMAELGLPSETYGSGKQPGRRFEESSPGTHVRNKCEAEQGSGAFVVPGMALCWIHRVFFQ